MKYVYQVMSYYSGWKPGRIYSSKNRAVRHAMRIPGSVVVVRVTLNSFAEGSAVEVWDK